MKMHYTFPDDADFQTICVRKNLEKSIRDYLLDYSRLGYIKRGLPIENWSEFSSRKGFLQHVIDTFPDSENKKLLDVIL